MSWWSDLAERARALLFRKEREEWLEQEMSFHLEMETEQNLRRGMSAEAARRAAQHSFGSVDRFAEEVRDARGVRPLEDFAQDVRYALRTLRRNPGLTASAIFVLALGIGANTAIFSAVNAVVLRALPVHRPDRLYAITEENPEKGWHHQVAAPSNYLDWKDQVAAFDGDVAAYTLRARTRFGGMVLVVGNGSPQVIKDSEVTGNFFRVLGVRPELGRVLEPDETWDTGERVAVLSHAAWLRFFGGDRRVVRSIVQLNGLATRIVGVMPASFTFPRADVEMWQPFRWSKADMSQAHYRRAHWLNVVARVKDGITPELANQQLQVVVERLKKQYPLTNRVMGAEMVPLHTKVVGDARTPLLVLFAAVGVLLLIACANVGNLLLVKAAGRQRELAVRAALGARRLRIVRQLLTESLVLSLLGGIAGLAIGWSGTRALEQIQPLGLLPVENFQLDVRVIAYSLGIALLSGLLFGVAPAFTLARQGSQTALREGGRSGGVGRRARRAASLLVVAEVALAVVLVTGAGLLVKSFWKLQNADPGFDARGVFSITLELPGSRYDTNETVLRFSDALLEKARALPGVQVAAASTSLPLEGGGWTSDFAIAGRGREEYGVENTNAVITSGFFRAVGMTLLRGRDFNESDRPDNQPVVIINDVLAKKYFAGQDPVGQRITFQRYPDSTSVWNTIVGVVRGERQVANEAPRAEAYFPMSQGPNSFMNVVVRASGDPARFAPLLRAQVRQLDPALAVFAERSLRDVQARAVARQRFLMTLLAVFATVALVLAVVGVYGVTAQAARQRTQEIGIRMALGARAPDVLSLVVREGMATIVAGLVIGLSSGMLLSRMMTSLLYETAPTDGATFAAVALALAVAGVLASWLPARRASRVDPALLLRS